jgi:hypothetical protein
MDTGEIIDKGQYRASIEPQLVVSQFDGFNMIGRFDVGRNESSSMRFLMGGGSASGFEVGGFYKWIPIPDYENQPAIGLTGGAIFASPESTNLIALRVHPVISKKFKALIIGDDTLIPYASLPLGVTFAKAKNYYPLQLAVGSEYRPEKWKKMSVSLEIGMNLHDAFSYISAAFSVDFDEAKGVIFE